MSLVKFFSLLMISSHQLFAGTSCPEYYGNYIEANRLLGKQLQCTYNGKLSAGKVSRISEINCGTGTQVLLEVFNETVIVQNLRVIRGYSRYKYVFDTDKVDGISCTQK